MSNQVNQERTCTDCHHYGACNIWGKPVSDVVARACPQFEPARYISISELHDLYKLHNGETALVIHAVWKTSNGVVRCSHCDRGYHITKYGPNTRTFAFCPNCGARME